MSLLSKSPRGSGRVLVRGESLVASAGLAAAAILLIAMASAAWVALEADRESARTARESQVRAVSRMLAKSAEGLLETDQYSAVRRLVSEAATGSGLEVCRITLPGAGGVVVADGAPAEKVKYQKEMPEAWGSAVPLTGTEVAQVQEAWDGDAFGVRAILKVTGRGEALLETAETTPLVGSNPWRMQAGMGLVGAAGLLGLLLTYRRARWRLRGLGAIHEALQLAAKGGTTEDELRLSPDLGPEAAVWNALIAERQNVREQAVAGRAGEQLSGRRGRDGELSGLCDALWQGVVLIDDRMKVKYANGAAAVFVRTKREELIGSEFAGTLDDPRILEAVRGITTGTARNRSTFEVERKGENGQSSSVLRLTVRPVRKDDSAAALVVIEDVTQQKVADEARNSFVAQATHELRTPLTNIRLYVETLLEEDGADETKRMQAVNVISQESRRLERIVGDMLSVSEIEAGSMKLHSGDVRIETLFGELATDYEAQAKDKDISLRFDLPPKLPVLRGDRDKIAMAVHNLVGNAIKYTPAGGEVTVRVAEEKGRLLVDVVDNGIGIKEEECDLIFEKFYRAKDRRIANVTGTGLGLAIAREVVRLHGGDITVRSQVDKGSTFTLALPVGVAA